MTTNQLVYSLHITGLCILYNSAEFVNIVTFQKLYKSWFYNIISHKQLSSINTTIRPEYNSCKCLIQLVLPAGYNEEPLNHIFATIITTIIWNTILLHRAKVYIFTLYFYVELERFLSNQQ